LKLTKKEFTSIIANGTISFNDYQACLKLYEKAEKWDSCLDLGKDKEPEDYLGIARKCLDRELEKDQKLIDSRKENKALKEKLKKTEMNEMCLSDGQAMVDMENGTLKIENKRLQKQWDSLVDPWLDEHGVLKAGIIHEIRRNKEIVENLRQLNEEYKKQVWESPTNHRMVCKHLDELLAVEKTKEGDCHV